jgi:hypothetical protein
VRFNQLRFSDKPSSGKKARYQVNIEEIASKRINQVIHWFGDGRLLDGSQCSEDLRTFLNKVPSARLNDYVQQCLTEPFDNSGLVLQDLINEFGRRLDFVVENGKYKGRQGAVGYDGIWRQETHDFVIEVKTSDAYNTARCGRRLPSHSVNGWDDQAQFVHSDSCRAPRYWQSRSSSAWLAARVGYPHRQC